MIKQCKYITLNIYECSHCSARMKQVLELEPNRVCRGCKEGIMKFIGYETDLRTEEERRPVRRSDF